MNSKFYVYSHFTKEKNDLEESIHKTEHQIVELEEETAQLEKERIYYYNSIGIFSKLFKTRKYIDITKIIKKNTENILSSKACRDNFKILQYYWDAPGI